MRLQRVHRALSIAVGLAAVSSAVTVPSMAASQPTFDVVAKGRVGFGCAKGGQFPNCKPFVYLLTGTAPASGTPIGEHGTFNTRESATPISKTHNRIDGHAVVTAADGDKIFIHYTGLSPAPAADKTGVGHLNDDLRFSITGGTGRYAGAQGSGRLTATGAVYYDKRPTIVSSKLLGTIKTHAS